MKVQKYILFSNHTQKLHFFNKKIRFLTPIRNYLYQFLLYEKHHFILIIVQKCIFLSYILYFLIDDFKFFFV
jgi:hypothetical protein